MANAVARSSAAPLSHISHRAHWEHGISRGASLAASGLGVLRARGAALAGSTWTAFDEPVSPTAPAPGVALDVGSSVWAASAPSTSALEEKGWAKFTDFQPFCW